MANLLPPGSGLGAVIAGLNYALANMNTTAGDANVLVADAASGIVTTSNGTGSTGSVTSYLYNYIHIYYGNTATGSGFTSNATGTTFYGVQNSSNLTPSSNPTDYSWYEVTGGFPSGNALYYLPLGGNQINFFAGNTPPVNFLPVLDSTPIPLYIGGNAVVSTPQLQTAAVTTPTIATSAITNSVSSEYISNFVSQPYYKRPKLVNYSYYTWTANNNSLITAVTITPTESNSTLLVNYSLFFDNDAGTTANNYVGLWRSCNEGLLDPLAGQGPYSPYFPYQFRKVKMAYPDPNSTSNIANATVVIGGHNIGTTSGYGWGAIYATGEFNAAGTYTSNILVGNTTNSGVTYSYANLYYSSHILGKPTYYGAINAVQYNTSVGIEFPPTYRQTYANVPANAGSYPTYYTVTATDWESWALTGGTGPVHHNYLLASVVPYNTTGNTYIDPQSGQMIGTQFYCYIARSDNDNNGNVTVELALDLNQSNPWNGNASNYGKINGIAHDVAPYSNVRVSTAVAVGDFATIFSSSRTYSNSGAFVSSSGWSPEYNGLSGYFTYTGNLNAVAYSGPNGSQRISTLVAGAGKAANATNSGTFVAVGEDGIIIQRPAGGGVWAKVYAMPPQAHTVNLRGICYDNYRYRWWIVGDYGTILWADDYVSAGNPYLVFNTYNSGTLRNLYDITWDPVTGYWTAVGDGVVITDNGNTLINGQLSYPQSKTYAFDAMAGLYGNLPTYTNPIMNYEPLPILQTQNNPTSIVLDGFTEFPQGSTPPARAAGNTVVANVTLLPGQVIGGTYTEIPNPVIDGVIFNHNSYTPVTFYLVAGCANTSNLIIGSPILTVTEVKR